MNNKILFYIPRVLAILFIAFLSIFALDVFSEYKGFNVIVPLFMHLLPEIILLIALIIFWKKDFVNAAIFLFIAIFYIFVLGPGERISLYLTISGPALLVSILFLVNWIYNKR